MHTSVGLYLRISRDDGTTLAVERQEQECRRKAQQLGWQITRTYTDQGKSASNRKVVRPEYDRLLSDAQSGAIAGVITWAHDRLTRQPEQLGAWLDLADTGFKLATVSGELDLGSDSGRLAARIFVAVAEQEGRRKGARQAASNRQRAEQGLPISRQRHFGYEPDGMTVVEAEAELIKDAVAGLIAGTHSLNGIKNQWNKLGILSTYGNQWKTINLKRILTSYKICGVSAYRQKTATPEIFAAQWPAIVSREDVELLRTILSDPARKGNFVDTKVRNLLSYVAVCHCGAQLAAISGNRGSLDYRCTKCFTSIKRAIADDRVTKAVAVALSDPGFNLSREVVSEVRKLREQLAQIDADTSTLSEMYNARQINLTSFQRMNQGNADERVRLETEINSRIERDQFAALIDGLVLRANKPYIATTVSERIANAGVILERFNTLDIEQKRTVIRGLFPTITLHKSATPGRQSEAAIRARLVIEGESEGWL